MPQLLLGDMLGAANAGFDRGTQLRANQLIGQAYQDPTNANALLGQAAGLDPRSAQNAMANMSNLNAVSRKDALNDLVLGASLVKSAYQRGGIQAAQGAYARVWPSANRSASMLGLGGLPQQFDESMLGEIDGIIGAAQGANDVPSQIQTMQYVSKFLTPDEQKEYMRVTAGVAPRKSSAAIQWKSQMGSDSRSYVIGYDPNDNAVHIPQLPPGVTIPGITDGTLGSGVRVVQDVGESPQPAGFSPVTAPDVPQGAIGRTVAGPDGSRIQIIAAPGSTGAEVGALEQAAGLQPQPVQPQGVNPFASPTIEQQAQQKEAGTQAARTAAMPAQNALAAQGAAQTEHAKQLVTMRQDARKGLAAIKSSDEFGQVAIDMANRLLAAPGLQSLAGWSGLAADFFPPGQARDAANQFKQLQSYMQLRYLTQLRGMTKTGGSPFGSNASDMEQRMLKSAATLLAPGQSVEQQRAAIQQIIDAINQQSNTMHESFHDEFAPVLDRSGGVVPFGGSAPAPSSSSGDINDLINQGADMGHP